MKLLYFGNQVEIESLEIFVMCNMFHGLLLQFLENILTEYKGDNSNEKQEQSYQEGAIYLMPLLFKQQLPVLIL